MQAFDLTPHTVNGLRWRSDIPRNAPYCSIFTNLMACERRAKQLPTMTWPAGFPTESASWPLAEAVFDERVALGVVDEVFSTLDPSALTSTELTLYPADEGTTVLTNGTFTGSATGWTLGSWTYSSNRANATTVTGTIKQEKANMATPWTDGLVYEVTFTITRAAGSLTIGTNTNDDQGATYTADGTYTALVTADAHADGIVFTGTGFTGTLDTVSCISTYYVSGTGPWHFATFLDSWFATNGTSLVYSAPSTASNKVVGHNSTFSAQTVCNWNDRLVLGGLAGTRLSDSSFTDFYDLWRARKKTNVVTSEDDTVDTTWLLIGPPVGGDSKIPNGALLALLGLPSDTAYTTVFEPLVRTGVEQGLYDLLPLRHCGAIKASAVYGNDLIVYGTEGISRVRATEFGPVEEKICPVGIWGRAAFGGSDEEIASVGIDGNGYMVGAGAQRYARERVYVPEVVGRDCYRLGGSEYLGTLNAGDGLRVVYDPTDQYYWFADGDDCFLLSRTGLCRSLGVIPACVLRMPGQTGLIGSSKEAASGADVPIIKFVPFDAGMRDPYTVDRLELTTTDTASSANDRWKARMNTKLQKHLAETTFSYVFADTRGVASVEMYGIEHAPELTAADRTKVDLDAIGARLDLDKAPDMRLWLDTL